MALDPALDEVNLAEVVEVEDDEEVGAADMVPITLVRVIVAGGTLPEVDSKDGNAVLFWFVAWILNPALKFGVVEPSAATWRCR